MVGKYWTMNMMGFTLDEEKISKIPFPTTELTLHVTTKTVQAGGLLGTMVAGPITALAKGQFNADGVKKSMENCGYYGVMVGLVAGPLMTYAKIKSASTDAIWDRCYRLRYNRNQIRADRMFLVGAAAGCAAASYLGDSATLGALLGMNGGLILSAVVSATLT